MVSKASTFSQKLFELHIEMEVNVWNVMRILQFKLAQLFPYADERLPYELMWNLTGLKVIVYV